jgi:hypothetical protein
MSPEDETVYLLCINRVTPDGAQYVKTWCVSQEMEDWLDENLGAPHSETMASNNQVTELETHAAGVIHVVNEAGES